jgi:hypothetical protein
MPRRIFAFALMLAASAAVAGEAACLAARDGSTVCPQPGARCLADRYGEIHCSTPGGGIVADRYGVLVCGPGQCTTDRRGDVWCSGAKRGAASVDRFGEAACASTCVPARARHCVQPVPAAAAGR